jgi:diguanylate cyclase (GGDEF)-like protein
MEAVISDTSRHQLQTEINGLELNQILSAIRDPIWILRGDGVVIRSNDTMLKLLNKDSSAIISLINSSLYSDELDLRPGCLQNDAQDLDIQLDDEYAKVATAPLATRRVTNAAIAYFKDITLRKQTKRQLKNRQTQLAEGVNIDGLTQVANHRHFEVTLRNEWQRLHRTRKPLSLILIDIDYLKSYNDHYGQHARNQCMIQIATTLKSTLNRPADFVARYGNEEFVVLLPETPLEGANDVAEQTTAAIAELKLPHCVSSVSKFITISQGIASTLPTDEMSPADLIHLAEKALCLAKVQGGNRFVTN